VSVVRREKSKEVGGKSGEGKVKGLGANQNVFRKIRGSWVKWGTWGIPGVGKDLMEGEKIAKRKKQWQTLQISSRETVGRGGKKRNRCKKPTEETPKGIRAELGRAAKGIGK